MSEQLRLPQPIDAFIKATNAHHADELLAMFTDSAVITDEGQEYRGIAAIKTWSDEKYIGARVTLDVVDVIERADETVVTAVVDGDFDKTGLPDPFHLGFHFIVDGNMIAALNIRLAGEP
jgi:hypothetical protein